METKNIQQFLNSYSVKMVVVAVLALLLLIPSFLIMDIIQERIALSETVKQELHAQWGGRQVVSGPVLNVPHAQGVAHFLPENLTVDGALNPETRKRGIYTVAVFEATLRLSGDFTPLAKVLPDPQHAHYQWDAAYFTFGISDMRGIRNTPVLVLDGVPREVRPGLADTDLSGSGITVMAGIADPTKPMHFDIDLVLNGSESLQVEALGKTSSISLQSDWPEPSFAGAFLPEQRSVTADGFAADWRVTHLNRNFPQQWIGDKFSTDESAVGVELLIPADHYRKSMRSVKYAILFIGLNFIVFLFIEIKSKVRIHPFQYSLVAFALLLFYLLLLSLGEQIGFNPAYLVSAIAVTALISWYVAGILKDMRIVGWVILLQAGLYGFLFAILQMQDYALLTGSIGLFVILAAIMRASGRIRWYADQ